MDPPWVHYSMLHLETLQIIIAIVAINTGLIDLVKTSITGAVLGNILLIFGLSILVGGFRYKEQYFSQQNVGLQSVYVVSGNYWISYPYHFS